MGAIAVGQCMQQTLLVSHKQACSMVAHALLLPANLAVAMASARARANSACRCAVSAALSWPASACCSCRRHRHPS